MSSSARSFEASLARERAPEVASFRGSARGGLLVEISVDTRLCKGCEVCIDMCPTRVLERSKELSRRGLRYPVAARIEQCIACRLCEVLCPDFAIWVKVSKAQT